MIEQPLGSCFLVTCSTGNSTSLGTIVSCMRKVFIPNQGDKEEVMRMDGDMFQGDMGDALALVTDFGVTPCGCPCYY